jgi:hypothetical protein
MPEYKKSEPSNPQPGKVNLTPHPLVTKLHPEPDALNDLVALIGYFGPSKKAGCIRLYADLSFRSFYDIPTKGIVHTEPTDAKDENSPTKVLVLAVTKLEVVETTSQCVEASYLQGPIARDYLAGAPLGALRSTGEALVSIISNCCPPEGGGGGGGGGGGSLYYSQCCSEFTPCCISRPPCSRRGRC